MPASVQKPEKWSKQGLAIIGGIVIVTAFYFTFLHSAEQERIEAQSLQQYRLKEFEEAKAAWRVHVEKDPTMSWVVSANSQSAKVTDRNGRVLEGELGTLNLFCFPAQLSAGLEHKGIHLSLFFIDRDSDVAPRKDKISIETYLDGWSSGNDYEYQEYWVNLERKAKPNGQFTNVARIDFGYPYDLIGDIKHSRSIAFKLPWKDKYLEIDTRLSATGIDAALRKCEKIVANDLAPLNESR